MNRSATLSLQQLTIGLADRDLLREVTLQLKPAAITVIVGGSGAGKSVFLRTLAGLVPADDAAIRWTGKILIGQSDPSDDSFQPLPQARVGIVFQNFALLDQWSPRDNVQLAIDHRSNLSALPSQSAEAWLEELRVPTGTAVSVLSGGQKQRLAIARTLAADPDIIFYDEPTSGLDAASGRQVAELIRHTQTTHQRTSIVVTHDYETLLPIADDVLLLDPAAQTLQRIDRDQWSTVAQRIQPVKRSVLSADRDRPSSLLGRLLTPIDRLVTATGAGVLRAMGRRATGGQSASIRTQSQPRPAQSRWMWRFFIDYLKLVGGLSAMLYLTVAGLIVGFTATYFTFEFLPYRIYTKPLLLEDLLSSIGFALYRILVPILATILIAARCGAAITADVGVKRYGAQIDALQTLAIRPRRYLLLPIWLACLIATPLLTALAFQVARLISSVSFQFLHPELGPHFWYQHFHARIASDWFFSGDRLWVLAKTLLCGSGVALISYWQGNRPKQSASDVSHAITSTVLWGTLYVLLVHFLVALAEF